MKEKKGNQEPALLGREGRRGEGMAGARRLPAGRVLALLKPNILICNRTNTDVAFT